MVAGSDVSDLYRGSRLNLDLPEVNSFFFFFLSFSPGCNPLGKECIVDLCAGGVEVFGETS